MSELGLIATRVQAILDDIEDAANRVGRDPATVRLVAATKMVSPAMLGEAYAANVRIFGENRLQEAQEKQIALGTLPHLSWHFIGRMQHRKLKEIVGYFEMLHSVENVKQGEMINRLAEGQGRVQEVLLQVNIGEEASKGGFFPQHLEGAVEQFDRLPQVRVKGLMTLPPFRENPEGVRPFFTKMAQLRDTLSGREWARVRMDELSMGMSHDFQVAIEEGATMVRIGTGLFGERALKK